MNLILIGTNHKYSPIQIRGKLVISKRRLRESLRELTNLRGIKAAVILSTCNRIELYADVLDTALGVRTLKEFFLRGQQQELEKFEAHLYTYIGKVAILHLFHVASGMDSQILGENQILEQVRLAYTEAREANTINTFLSNIFNKAIDTGIKVRNKTKISQGNITIASIAISLMKEKFVSLKDKKIFIIGVGKISELVVRALKKEGTKVVFIANRTYEKALELARYIDAEVVKFNQLRQKLMEADIVISATSSPHLILKKEDILEVMNHRQLINDCRPLLIIDLAVPRDVEQEIRHIEGINLFCLDDLDFIIKKNIEKRIKEVPRALEIIKEEVENLCLVVEPLESELAEARLP